MKLSTHPESPVARNIYKILPCNEILHAVLEPSIKKKQVSNLRRTQIGRKLENNLNGACSTSDHCTDVAPLKETTTHLLVFSNKDVPCSRKNEGTRGKVT